MIHAGLCKPQVRGASAGRVQYAVHQRHTSVREAGWIYCTQAIRTGAYPSIRAAKGFAVLPPPPFPWVAAFFFLALALLTEAVETALVTSRDLAVRLNRDHNGTVKPRNCESLPSEHTKSRAGTGNVRGDVVSLNMWFYVCKCHVREVYM